jgi:hypothetical protein
MPAPMNDASNTTATLDQADEDILTYTVCDEAIEAAEREKDRPVATLVGTWQGYPYFCC